MKKKTKPALALMAVFVLLYSLLSLTFSALAADALRPGNQGEAVQQMQSALLALGYDIKVDGKYGKDTKKMVALYQAAQGIKQDGIAGADTLALLLGVDVQLSAEAPATVQKNYDTLRPGMRNTSVKAMQEALIKKGYQLTADGSYGRDTSQAVRAFQRANKLRVDGIAGNQTLTLLFDGVAEDKAQAEQAAQAASLASYDYTAPDALRGNVVAPVSHGATVAHTLKRGGAPEQIAYLQQALLKNGTANLETDGSYGSQTAAAVRNYQERYGLTTTGAADPGTLALLYLQTGTSSDALLFTGINHSGKKLTIRTRANAGATAVMDVQPGAAMTILLEEQGYYLVSYKQKTGYVQKDQLRIIQQPAPLVNLSRGFDPGVYAQSGDHKADLLGLAFTQLGFSGGSSNRQVLDGTGPGGPYSKYGDYFQDPSESYCSYFISWSARKAGIGEGIINNARDVDGLFYDAQQAFVYFFAPKAAQVQAQSLSAQAKMEQAQYTPQAGDLIYFRWANAKAQTTFSHIGIVYLVEGDWVYTLEGAAGGSVDTRMYRLTDNHIMGYARPRYQGE